MYPRQGKAAILVEPQSTTLETTLLLALTRDPGPDRALPKTLSPRYEPLSKGV